MSTVNGQPHPEGVFSLLDTDLYKLTMHRALRQWFPDVPVKYRFTNRTPHMQLNRRAFRWLQKQVAEMADIKLTDDELVWLESTCRYLDQDYLQYLKGFKLRPDEHVKLDFNPESEHGGDDVFGELWVTVEGLWVETILYEVPLLALISEAYFKFVDTDWTHDGQTENAKQKGLKLIENGCVFSEFGSRRRRDYETHQLVVQGLVAAQKDSETNNADWRGKFSGTSNVHMAMRFGVAPIGTVAHEWFMGIAALTDNYADANEKALQYWTGTFGRGVLSIALTDTFGTPAFLRSFCRPAPKSGTIGTEREGSDPTYAEIFTGVRQDSGDPMEYIGIIKDFYTKQGISDKKTIVFSDALNVEKCIKYKEATDAVGLTPSFGVGTFLTNDFVHASEKGKKSVPLNIVIKLSEAQGRAAIKLSDDRGKNTGADELVSRIKKEVRYEEKTWVGGDEAHRWDK
ncbi:nicotinate phosphoribosyltransferase [Friedmanniomyces endolithicus]|uniref:Nicotinate phosphoribosyltransferase n=1 Tax=Friedmanniomyces endolithicus TaxID=329885 RepID=A0AAN6KBC6_9PEZI|nr:nicotinate phosphoribosyltransferase [Friedmanniomyces endolithicus]KAK0883254.1 nicotinate phosphoribosyltransferase [Friedmanniomyces endolithicus]KAK0914250.1 nicotinate phosphoribosyltransferase [Friedmanniomyces endolithicus]KAK0973407.1 nicotinate phosphoribosyltransferase [Friedmanniomyces endolithicus]KAK0978635.1 nicotinate phosphoribosyltransferase [Friedmanniomyces endolithicus]